jgi:nitrite reductase/ring-hydroxylating ferredoxin subunit
MAAQSKPVSAFPQPSPTWRARLSILLLILLTGLVVALVGVSLKFATPPSTWSILGTARDYPPSPHPYEIRISQATFYLVKTGDEFLALSAKHPHRPYCFINWIEAESRYIDPCLGTQFNLDGSYISGPIADMERYPILVKDGQISVDLSRRIPGPHKFDS